jgi:hypothetical protein
MRGAIPQFSDVVYRSSFTYNADKDLVTMWYSGAHYDEETARYDWHLALQRIPRSDLLANVATAPPTPPVLTPSTDVMMRQHRFPGGWNRPSLNDETAP